MVPYWWHPPGNRSEHKILAEKSSERLKEFQPNTLPSQASSDQIIKEKKSHHKIQCLTTD